MNTNTTRFSLYLQTSLPIALVSGRAAVRVALLLASRSSRSYNDRVPPTLLQTKLYFPPARPTLVPRPRFTARVSDGQAHPLTLISSAPAWLSTARGLLPDPLSERELEILRRFGEGHSNEDLARRLIISLGPVKAHSSNIYRRLDVRNRAQAIMTAREMNLL